MKVDDLLCNATEEQLRNVLALSPLTDEELTALFVRVEKIEDAQFAREAHISLR